MKYNLLVRDENEGLLTSIIDSAQGRLVIASDNSFVISSIVEELKPAAMAGGFELYNGDVKVNPHVTSSVQIVAINTNDKGSVASKVITYDFMVATLTRESKESFSFDIKLESIRNVAGIKQPITDSHHHLEDEPKEDIAKILNSIRDNNVVFVQDLNDKVIKSIQDQRDDTTVFGNISSFSNEYVITGDDGVMIAKFDAPENNTIEHQDCMSFVPNALKSGVTVVCNTSWVRFFLELTSIEYDVSLSSIVVYNTSNFGPMGNQDLYKVDN